MNENPMSATAGAAEEQPRKPRATDKEQGPKFFLDVEGVVKPWDDWTITTEQIIALGGWDPSLGALLIDADNNERPLAPGETVDLKPGMGFSKKIRFKRG